jgi:histidinol-phosphate aminotransferase
VDASDLRALFRPELSDLAAYTPELPPGVVAKLDANEAPPIDSKEVRDAVLRAIGRVALERYPDPRAAELKARIGERTGAKAAELVVGCGSDEVIALLATALARPRGAAPQAVVLTPTPTFVMYRLTARGHGLKPVEVPLDAEWDLDVATIQKAIAMMRPNLVFVASPNNPTGNRAREDRLEKIAEATAGVGALFVIDEAYVDYAREGSLRVWRERYAHVAILRTLSKVGLAALRIGWLEADEAVCGALDKVRQPFNVSATSQAAAAAVLDEAWDAVLAHVGAVVAERTRVTREIQALGAFEVTPSEANFVWVKAPRPAEEVHEALLKHGVLVRSFHQAGGRMARQLRITIGTPPENDRLLEALPSCGR